MNDNEKPKSRLIEELNAAREKIALLEKSESSNKRSRLSIRNLAYNISNHFLKSNWQSFEKDINSGLEKIGNFAGVERAMLILIRDDGITFGNSYLWRSPGLKAVPMTSSNFDPVPFNWLAKKAAGEDVIIISSPDELPEEAESLRDYINDQGIGSCIGFGLKYHGNLIGMLGLASSQINKHWSEDDVYLLKLIGDVFLSAILSQKTYRRLEESEKRYKYLYHKGSTLNLIIGTDFKLKDVNESFLNNIQYSRDEIIGINIFEFLPQKEIEKVNSLIDLDFRGIETPASDIDFIDKDGTVRTILFSQGSVPIVEDNKLTGILVSGIDVTDLQKYRRKLRISEEKYHRLFDMGPVMSVITSVHDGKIIEANKTFLETMGYNNDEVIGKSTIELKMVRENIRNEYISDLVSNGLVKSFEVKFYTKSGEERYGLLSLDRIIINGNEFTLSAALDITDRKLEEKEKEKLISELRQRKLEIEENIYELERLNNELRLSESRLKNTIEEKDKFFGIIAHDIRGPFSGFINLTETLTRDFSRLTLKEIQSYSGALYNSASSLYRLLENLLEWSRLQRGVIPYRPFNLNLKLAVDSSVLVERNNADKKKITIENQIPDNIYVFADEVMLETVLRNLLSNAVKFTRKGGEVLIEGADSDDKVVITISDNGIGMDEKALGKIFKLDKHYTTVGTSNERGTGLGLILCKEFVEKNKGKIDVESEKGKGTKFVLKLPKGKKQEIVI